MTDGQFIERATLDLWAETQQEQRDTITTLRAQLAAANARADRAEAERAAQIKVDAKTCDRIAGNTKDFNAETRRAAGMCASAIRAQPHDRSALGRMLAEAREKALREAYHSLFKHPGFIHAISGQKFKAVKLEDAAGAILALIENKEQS